MHKRNIQRLTQTYLTLSLQDIANSVQLNSAKEAEMHVLQMVNWYPCDGDYFCHKLLELHPSLIFVLFLLTYRFKTVKYLQQLTRRMEWLAFLRTLNSINLVGWLNVLTHQYKGKLLDISDAVVQYAILLLMSGCCCHIIFIEWWLFVEFYLLQFFIEILP